MSIAKQLAKVFGGKWTYYPYGWECDDGVRHVARVSAGVDEFDNDVGPAQYWMYGAGTPVRFWPNYRMTRTLRALLGGP